MQLSLDIENIRYMLSNKVKAYRDSLLITFIHIISTTVGRDVDVIAVHTRLPASLWAEVMGSPEPRLPDIHIYIYRVTIWLCISDKYHVF